MKRKTKYGGYKAITTATLLAEKELVRLHLPSKRYAEVELGPTEMSRADGKVTECATSILITAVIHTTVFYIN